MFYGRGFRSTLLTNMAISVVVFVVAIIFSPMLALTVGGAFTRLVIVCGALFWRFNLARVGAREMWQLNAPTRRILFNLVPAGMLGSMLPLLPFATISTLGGQSLAVVNVVVDSLFVGAIMAAATLVEKPTAQPREAQ